MRTERDIIFFDIRGVGVSQRLGFEECLVLALENTARADQITALQAAAARFLNRQWRGHSFTSGPCGPGPASSQRHVLGAIYLKGDRPQPVHNSFQCS